MILFDLHCDTATELYYRNLPFETQETHVNSHTVRGITLTQCFAVFFREDLSPEQGADLFRKVAESSLPRVKQEGVTPILTGEGVGILSPLRGWEDLLAAYGCRMAGLVWNGKNPLATGAVTDDRAPLTPRGKEAIGELTRRSIILDVSHLSAAGTDQVLSLTQTPVAASHSNARTVCNHPRNLTDSAAREIFARGGVVGLNLYPPFLSSSQATPDDLLRHAEHFFSLGGERGVALGCDLDGIDRLPLGMKDLSSLFLLYDRFLSAFGKETADRVFYQNAQAFFARLA